MAAGIIMRSSFARDLKPIVRDWFGKAYKDHPELYKQMFRMDKTNDGYEEYASLAGLGAAQLKTEGGSITYDSAKQLFNQRIQILTYGLGFKVSREYIEDGKALKFAQRRAVEFKKAALESKEIRGANVLNRAFNSSYTGPDGKELCATDHPTLGADVSNTLAVAADLSEASLEQALIDLKKTTDNRGLRKVIQGKRLIVPPELEYEACRILKGTERPGTADREISALNKKSLLQADPIVNPYLTDADAFFILTDVDDGLIYLNRRDMEMDSDNDTDTQNACFVMTFRDAFFWNDFRGIYGSPGA